MNNHFICFHISLSQVWMLMIDWFDLPKLTTFVTAHWAFHNTTSFSLESTSIAFYLIWSSHANRYRYCRWFIPECYSISHYGRFDYCWLIKSISLNLLPSMLQITPLLVLCISTFSVCWLLIDWFDLPKFTTFTTGIGCFKNTVKLNLTSTKWLMIG